MTAECTDLLHSLALCPGFLQPPQCGEAVLPQAGCARSRKLASGPVDITPGKGARRVLEDRHGGSHAPKSKGLVESLLARHRIQDDFPVRGREVNEPFNDRPSSTL